MTSDYKHRYEDAMELLHKVHGLLMVRRNKRTIDTHELWVLNQIRNRFSLCHLGYLCASKGCTKSALAGIEWCGVHVVPDERR